jgi:hypothetical protein
MIFMNDDLFYELIGLRDCGIFFNAVLTGKILLFREKKEAPIG